ncbi:MAG: hypothetical protein IKB43_12685 [Fibrobacter sp.]|nr:hypothetical protein [Fibrobacter sp.]
MKKETYIRKLKKNPVLSSANLFASADDMITLIIECKHRVGEISFVNTHHTGFTNDDLKTDEKFFVAIVEFMNMENKKIISKVHKIDIERDF